MYDGLFARLEQQRTQALVARDMPSIERLHAPDYELISPTGRVYDRDRYLSMIAEKPFYASWEIGPMKIRSFERVALLRYPATLTFPSGKVIRCWHTDSYELRDGDWQAVWSQATELPRE